jgi:hypothetical protein
VICLGRKAIGAASAFGIEARRQTRTIWSHCAGTGILVLLTLCSAQFIAAQAMIQVTTTAQGVSDPAHCSLQEAIYSSEFKLNIAISAANPDTRETRDYLR